jgi:TrfA protein
LRGKSLVLWLHAFYASHDQPYSYKVETLRTLSGSRNKELKTYRQKLRKALAELQGAGAIATWTLDRDDLVRVRKVMASTA